MKLVTRVRRSVAFRSGPIYRRALSLARNGTVGPKPSLPVTFLTFGGRGHRLMLRECLLSMGQSWGHLPRVRIVSDGTLHSSSASMEYSWWHGSIEVVEWNDLVSSRLATRYPALVRFAEREPMGRKMAAIVMSALEGPTLYCDVDILWYRLPSTLRNLLAEPRRPRLVMSTDFLPAYDPRLVPARLPSLATPPHFCAGLLYAEGDFLAECDVGALLEFAAQDGVGLTEQTILAEATRQLGRESWPANEIALFDDDRFSLGPSFRGRTWAARHYVGNVRHIFWRDALARRVGFRS